MIGSATNEQAFEALIEKHLVGSTAEERGAKADIAAQQPAAEHYYWGNPKDFDKTLALDLRRLWSFLESTQADVLADYKGMQDLRTELPKQLAKKVENSGIIATLREDFEVANIKLKLFYPQPSAGDSEIAKQKYAANQFSVTRQQTYSFENAGNEIDMVIYINGLPIFTFEFKNPWTGQTAHYNGIRQYKTDRSPKDPLLRFGRCLAHFAVDKDEAFFTTKLNGEKTHFMPFNQGLPNGQGAGNPVNPNGGYKTSYLWERILQKNTVADLISHYVLFDYGEAKTQKKVPHIMKNAKTLIFPRFHQLDVVEKLLADVEEKGVGKTYLIQHSAGSGKSNSLTWLAYQLLGAYPASEDAVRAKSIGTPLFNSVIVVTDRRLLDRQITDNIKACGNSDRIVAHADSSAELREAIVGGKRIIITTIQKFPFICDVIPSMDDRNFAVIIDEAHSSQSGTAADKMNTTFQHDKDFQAIDTDEILKKVAKNRKMSTNCSYFAFTATPKKETRERFGVKDAEGRYHPFHLYSMKQAIEEGFILDVLGNYTTYKSYYELSKSIEDNPLFNNAKAQRALRREVERDPKTIEAKAEIMLSHFDANVFRTHKLNGHAKALVVTKDIECAILYYQALTEIARNKKLPYNILIAFSGEKTVNGIEYTEANLNGFPDTKTAEEFNKEENKILVVANKYLTGFDQPKLSAMYIDKPLDGVLAVQAMSRLNRAAPDLEKLSKDLFILDFYNTIESTKEAFDPFFTTSYLTEATDVSVLFELKSTLLSLGVFEWDEVEAFIELYVKNADADQWAPKIDAAAQRFNNEIEWADNGKADFKMKSKQFVRVYGKMAAILPYENLDWEKLYWFLRYLIPQLIVKDDVEKEDIKDLLDSVDLNTYGLRRTELNTKIELDATESAVDPNKAIMVNAGDAEEKDPLDEILKAFNQRWFHGWQATPEEQKTKLLSMAKAVAEDADYQNLVVGNPDQDAVTEAMRRIIDKVVRNKRKGDLSLYKQYQHNETFKSDLVRVLLTMVQNSDYLVR